MASPLYPGNQNNRHPGLYVYHNCQVSTSSRPLVTNETFQEQYNGGPLRRHPSHQKTRSRNHTRSSSKSRRMASRFSPNERPSSPLARSPSLCRSYCISPLQLPPLLHGFDNKISGTWNVPRFSSNSKIPAPVNSLARARNTRERPPRQPHSPTNANRGSHFQLQHSRSRKLHLQQPARTTSQQSQPINSHSLNMDTDYGILGAFLSNPFADPPPQPKTSVQTENTSTPRYQLRVINDDFPDKMDTPSVTSTSTTSTTSTDLGGSTAASTPPVPYRYQTQSTSNRSILNARIQSTALVSRLQGLETYAADVKVYMNTLPVLERERERAKREPWFCTLGTLQKLVDDSLKVGDSGTWDRVLLLLESLENS